MLKEERRSIFATTKMLWSQGGIQALDYACPQAGSNESVAMAKTIREKTAGNYHLPDMLRSLE